MVRAWCIERHEPTQLRLEAQLLGTDLCVVLSGGDAPHIGAVTLSIPRQSTHSARTVANTSVLSISGHMDDVLFRELGACLAERLNRTVVITGGIHVDDASPALVEAIVDAAREMTRDLASRVERVEYSGEVD